MATAHCTKRTFLDDLPPPDDSGPGWLRDLRREAADRVRRLGLPGPREEEWKYTRLIGLGRVPYRTTQIARGGDVPESAIPSLPGADRLVFVDGRFAPKLSTDALTSTPEIEIGSLGAAIRDGSGSVEHHLGRLGDTFADHVFTALNTRSFEDGAYIRVGRDQAVERPLHIVFVESTANGPLLSGRRVLLLAEPGSSVSVVEDHVGRREGDTLATSVSEVYLGAGSKVDHVHLVREGASTKHISSIAARLQAGSRFSTHSLAFTGGLVRNDVRVSLEERDAECTLNGLLVGSGEQHVDNHTRIEHAAPDCRSWQLYKAILADRSTGVFNGRIHVHPGAQKTDAKQTNRALLLSDDATMNTKPELEIYADDVRCTHGATVGEIDEAAVFYLRSRGIDEELARNILTFAFSSEVIEQVPIEPLREAAERLLYSELPQAEELARG